MVGASSSSSRRRTVENPFIKAENRSWEIGDPASLSRPISPPPSVSKHHGTALKKKTSLAAEDGLPSTSAVESGDAEVTDQLTFWYTKLTEFVRPPHAIEPRLSLNRWRTLYKSHGESTKGSHFVVHQHDHPVAGTHYDLRLQCNGTSSVSFAIMYGLPGDPNSMRLNRNATETRVHCLWNHLIETASLATGSMLIWDTGCYEVLSFKRENSDPQTDGESSSDYLDAEEQPTSEQRKLHQAFSQRKVRLRLYGTRLPEDYTISLRLTKKNHRYEQPGPPSRKRKREPPKVMRKRSPQTTDSGSGSESSTPVDMGPFGGGKAKKSLSSLIRHETPPPRSVKDSGRQVPGPSSIIVQPDPGGSDQEEDDSREEIRKNNAYPGATNSIGSIHQRKWYLSMDRQASGFVPTKDKHGSRMWSRRKDADGTLHGFERFQVLGRDVERSIVTGRLAKEILEDEGVEGYVPRGLWRAVTE